MQTWTIFFRSFTTLVSTKSWDIFSSAIKTGFRVIPTSFQHRAFVDVLLWLDVQKVIVWQRTTTFFLRRERRFLRIRWIRIIVFASNQIDFCRSYSSHRNICVKCSHPTDEREKTESLRATSSVTVRKENATALDKLTQRKVSIYYYFATVRLRSMPKDRVTHLCVVCGCSHTSTSVFVDVNPMRIRRLWFVANFLFHFVCVRRQILVESKFFGDGECVKLIWECFEGATTLVTTEIQTKHYTRSQYHHSKRDLYSSRVEVKQKKRKR